MATRGCETARKDLRKKSIDAKVRKLLESMDVALRGVYGSESGRDFFRLKCMAVHMWGGYSLFSFTLIPQDIKNPLMLVYIGAQGVLTERISLDWDDQTLSQYECAQR